MKMYMIILFVGLGLDNVSASSGRQAVKLNPSKAKERVTMTICHNFLENKCMKTMHLPLGVFKYIIFGQSMSLWHIIASAADDPSVLQSYHKGQATSIHYANPTASPIRLLSL